MEETRPPSPLDLDGRVIVADQVPVGRRLWWVVAVEDDGLTVGEGVAVWCRPVPDGVEEDVVVPGRDDQVRAVVDDGFPEVVERPCDAWRKRIEGVQRVAGDHDFRGVVRGQQGRQSLTHGRIGTERQFDVRGSLPAEVQICDDERLADDDGPVPKRRFHHYAIDDPRG